MANPYFEIHQRVSGASALALELRKKLIWAYSWAVPSAEAIAAIASAGSVLEVGAGSGYWAWLLSRAGARVRATDSEPQQAPRWFEIHAPDSATERAHAARALLLCWPPLDSPVALEALRAHASNGGASVFYIGEWRGRTGDAAFHDALERDWRLVRTLEIPRWPGFEDRLHVFER